MCFKLIVLAQVDLDRAQLVFEKKLLRSVRRGRTLNFLKRKKIYLKLCFKIVERTFKKKKSARSETMGDKLTHNTNYYPWTSL
jgi:hypothetical protein